MLLMKCLGFPDGAQCDCAGLWLKRFDAEAYDGRGFALWTDKKGEAMKFRDSRELFAFWKTTPRNRPLRTDGKPNRPLTAFSIEVSHG